MSTSISTPFFRQPISKPSPLRNELNDFYRKDEETCVKRLLDSLDFIPGLEASIENKAKDLVMAIRNEENEKGAVESLMLHYDLSTEEGVLLMCLAEALLRIPDKDAENLLIHDKLTAASWERRVGESESFFVSSAIWGLALSGKILKKSEPGQVKTIWHRLIQKSGEPIIRSAVRKAMKLMSEHFVLGRTIEEALGRAKADKIGYRYSYDMLGEAASTEADAANYYKAYHHAILALGKSHQETNIYDAPSISVKLSALHPRYEFNKRETTVPILTQYLKSLALEAKEQKIGFTIDAEEANRLDISLDIFKALFSDDDFSGWEGLGLAVQAYQKRALPVLSWLIDLAREKKRRIPIRLVKGAYWDTEIKRTQMEGLNDYPVFTRKTNTDVSYLACAKKMLEASDAIYPQFATHNAYSVAAILAMVEAQKKPIDFEFQHLQGMGRALHDYVVKQLKLPCRVYAPVGHHEDLLPYLVRRLLENGANTSFVNLISNKNVPVEDLIQSPVAQTRALTKIANPKIPLPIDIFGKKRQNSMGIDLSNESVLFPLSEVVLKADKATHTAAPFLRALKNPISVFNPADNRHVVGAVELADRADVDRAIEEGRHAFFEWDRRGIEARAAILRKVADVFEVHYPELMTLIVREAGRTWSNALSEVREAVDFCRYYAEQAEIHLSDTLLPSYTGERDILRMRGRGIILCISPWNFPASIFTGQIAAALVTGNVVIAKPSGQTPLIGAFINRLFHEAGVPPAVFQLMPGSGAVIGQALIESPHVAGIVFTGSNAVARSIQKTLAERSGPMVPFVAETSGINAMIADSTILPQQLVRDVLVSAFDSAGQRCSALRLLFIQEEVADVVISMLAGAMAEITVGDPMLFETDVGPVIDENAKKTLEAHVKYLESKAAKLIHRVSLPGETQHGSFVAPQAYELPSIDLIKTEVFGPILHVIRYKRNDLDKVIDSINNLGYGLTFGIQSRIDVTVDHIQSRINAGNIYVNRNIVGAVVGVQPFGGSWLSGTGPKAGGPHYLSRFCVESTLTIDTTAAGGNASLMAMSEGE